MRLIKARVERFRSIMDTGLFDVELNKTILVGPNEAGKSALLMALQQLNPPESIASAYNPLRDYPRSKYQDDIVLGNIDQQNTPFVTGYFVLTEEEKSNFPEEYQNLTYVLWKTLNNQAYSRLENVPSIPTFEDIEKDLLRIKKHFSSVAKKTSENPEEKEKKIDDSYKNITNEFLPSVELKSEVSDKIEKWLTENIDLLDENNKEENARFDRIKERLHISDERKRVYNECKKLLPKFILFNNYFRIKPLLHLGDLVQRINENRSEKYDYGNVCLLKYLGFSPAELSNAANEATSKKQQSGFEAYRSLLDNRDYQLNAATIKLTDAIRNVWNPDAEKDEASKLRIKVDGQYLKVVVEDELGVEVELDQRSEGFQWLVSFFIVFFAEAEGKHKNAILLLDEPGLSLHALKQKEFRKTLSILSNMNQTLYTTHSPFLIGVDELNLVRVVEMKNRSVGTKVNTTITATDSGALLPLQEALGYDLAQSLFFHEKNLVLEGLTDLWYLEAISDLLKANDKTKGLDEQIALIPANSASKVVYYSTILTSQHLYVSALLDSDSAGDVAAEQDDLVITLGKKNIIRTKDAYTGMVDKPEIEDLLRQTLINIAREKLEFDVQEKALQQSNRPIIDILNDTYKKKFSKLRLAKEFIRWTAVHSFDDLTNEEQINCTALIEIINKSFSNPKGKDTYQKIKESSN